MTSLKSWHCRDGSPGVSARSILRSLCASVTDAKTYLVAGVLLSSANMRDTTSASEGKSTFMFAK